MKHRLLCPLLVGLFLACGGQSVTEADLSGNAYAATLQPDTAPTNDSRLHSLLAMAEIEYRFNDDHKGVYQGNFGAKIVEQPITWRIEADSLIIGGVSAGKAHAQSFALSWIEGGILLKSHRATFALIKQ